MGRFEELDSSYICLTMHISYRAMLQCNTTPWLIAKRLQMHHYRPCAHPKRLNLFFALLLPDTPFVVGHRTVNQYSVVVTADLACLCFGRCGWCFRLDFFQKLAFDGVSPLLPPLLFWLCLGLDFIESLSEDGVRSNFICRLEDWLTPIIGESVCLILLKKKERGLGFCTTYLHNHIS